MANLKNPLQGRRLILLISLLALISFLLLTLLKNSLTTIDANVNSEAALIQTSAFTLIATIIAYSFDTTVLLAISIAIAAYLFYKNYKKHAALLVGAMLGDATVLTMVKMLVHSTRPSNGIILETGFSFPSGHVTSTVVLFGLLTYVVWQRWKSSNAKILASIFSIIVAIIVGFSRIYLNVHWLSDILGGYSLGVFWLTFSIAVFQYLQRP